MDILLGGALGRMGREITRLCEKQDSKIVCGVDLSYAGQQTDYPIVKGFELVTAKADVAIDFSRPDGLSDLLSLCIREKMPLVLCTTGFSEAELSSIEQAAKSIAILRSANMSLGIHVLRSLVKQASKALSDQFDVEIIERHHNQKVDSPSGTALMLYESVKDGRGEDAPAVYGRYGRSAKRQLGEIGIHAVRGGTVTGEHEVCFYGDSEELILTHRAESRALFAQGAMAAAKFLCGKPAGMYTMENVVAEILR